MKSLKLEVEFRKGLWDVCDGNHDQQSRVGDYVVLWNILNNTLKKIKALEISFIVRTLSSRISFWIAQ